MLDDSSGERTRTKASTEPVSRCNAMETGWHALEHNGRVRRNTVAVGSSSGSSSKCRIPCRGQRAWGLGRVVS